MHANVEGTLPRELALVNGTRKVRNDTGTQKTTTSRRTEGLRELTETGVQEHLHPKHKKKEVEIKAKDKKKITQEVH